MLDKQNILKELQEVSPAIAILSRENVYSVPLNYFDGLAGNIMQLVNADVAGQSFPVATATPFTLPPDYFNTLAANIIANINQNNVDVTAVESELAEIAPLLNTIDKRMPYSVPQGYFEQLANRALHVRKPAVVIQMNGLKKVLNIAVAAVLTGAIAVSTYILSPSAENVTGQTSNFAALNIPAEVIKVSEAEIVDYLTKNSFGPEVSGLQILPDEDIDIDNIIKSVSEEEIREYLKDNKEETFRKPKEG